MRSGSSKSDAKRSSADGQASSPRPEPMREQDSRVDKGRVGEPGQQVAQGARTVPLQEGAEHRRRRPLPRPGRPQASLLHERPRPGGGPPLEPRQGRGRRPPGDEEFRARIRSHPPDRPDPLHDERVRGRIDRPGEHEVERTVEVHGEPTSSAKVGDGVAGDLLEPARHRVVAGEVRDISQPVRGGRHGDDIRGIAIVREGLSAVGAGGRDERDAVMARRERDRPGPQQHEPPRRPLRPDEVAEPPPERCIVGRPGHDCDVSGASGEEPHAVAFGQRRPSGPEPSGQRAGRGVGGRMEDADSDRSHRASLSVVDGREPVSGRRVRAYIGLGANVGDAAATLAAAVQAIDAAPGVHLRDVSRLYATAPVGVADQAEFHNAVVAVDVLAGPDPATGAISLLAVLKDLERQAGRQVRERWGPRELDLDLLVFGRARLAVERPAAARSLDADADPRKAAKLLEVPHREARERLFVLAPMADLAPTLVPPGWGETVATARRRRLGVEGPDAARPIGTWDRALHRWSPIEPD